MLAGNLLKWLKKQHKTSIKLHHSLYTLSIITTETVQSIYATTYMKGTLLRK